MYPSPSMGLVENMNKEVCGLAEALSHSFSGKGDAGKHN